MRTASGEGETLALLMNTDLLRVAGALSLLSGALLVLRARVSQLPRTTGAASALTSFAVALSCADAAVVFAAPSTKGGVSASVLHVGQ